jgi:hypothetical protein
MSKSNVVLIIIFNHRYDKNIERLEQLYKDKFSNIYHLVPFYDGDKENVIPVYGRSIFFQGYIAQGFNSFFKKEYQHYFFVADDMILNPAINERNYQTFFQLNNQISFISELMPLHDRRGAICPSSNDFWIGTLSAYYYKLKQKYIEAENEIPSQDKAISKLKLQGIDIQSIKKRQLFGKPVIFPQTLGDKARMLAWLYTTIRYPFKKKFNLPYPFIGAYSDMVIVSSDSIKEFCHYCGVFASTCLFAEVAIPTALVLATQHKIRVEKDLENRGRALWQIEKDYMYLENNFKNLNDILTNFPADYIYLHPVKLSKWIN